MLRVMVWNSKAVVALQEYRLGDIIRTLQGPVVSKPTQSSIQINTNKHVEDEYGSWMNHSCLSNTIISNNRIVATRNVGIGMELTFNYTRSETELSAPFQCFKCDGLIDGKETICPVYKVST